MTLTVRTPRDLQEVLQALDEAPPQTRLLAGGTDLMVELRTGRAAPECVIDLHRVRELRYVRPEDGGVRVGALTTCTDLVGSPEIARGADLLARAAWLVGAEQIRNRATIGGNLGTASPAADLNPVLVALDATVRLCSLRGVRDVACADFLCGYRTTLRRPDEVIESVFIAARPAGERRAFRKVGTRAAQSIAKVVLALAVVCDAGKVTRLRAAAGSVAERTVRLDHTARALEGRTPTPELVAAAARAALSDCTPIDDVRSTARYRSLVLVRVLRTLLEEQLAT